MDYKKALYYQLSLDFSLSPEQFPLQKNHFVMKRYLEGRRLYQSDGCILQILSMDSHMVICSTDSVFLSWMEQEYKEISGAWISEYGEIFNINQKLKEYGHYIADGHPFFIPKSLQSLPQTIAPGFEIQWYERDALALFVGNPRFTNAIGGDAQRPDMLAVAAIINGQIAGMAGASADSSTAWQIGIDVLPAYRGNRIGTTLTALLAKEVERRGFLPFYGTGASHIQSQKVAVGAGFVPAWWELYTKEMKPKKEREGID